MGTEVFGSIIKASSSVVFVVKMISKILRTNLPSWRNKYLMMDPYSCAIDAAKAPPGGQHNRKTTTS